MISLKNDDRSEPIYVCEEHARELGYRRDLHANANDLNRRAGKGNDMERELSVAVGGRSVPTLGRSGTASPEENVTVEGRQGKRHRYIFPLSLGLVLTGILVGLRLFRTILPIPQISEAPAAIALPQQASNALPQKEPAELPRAESPVTPDINTPPPQRNTQGADVAIGGSVAREVLPDVPQSAKDTIQGTMMVIVKVNVDPEGNVVHTEIEYAGPSRYFLSLALEAAEKWKFRPPTLDGQNVVSDWTLRFEFTRDETRAISIRNTA
jgi:TonB family protein